MKVVLVTAHAESGSSKSASEASVDSEGGRRMMWALVWVSRAPVMPGGNKDAGVSCGGGKRGAAGGDGKAWLVELKIHSPSTPAGSSPTVQREGVTGATVQGDD